MAQESPASPVGPADTVTRAWTFSATATGYILPHDTSYVSPTLNADHKHLHLEGRYNYEDQRTGSLWTGYNFKIGEKWVLEATAMIGGVFGNTNGVAPGYRASLIHGRIAVSTEGEYVFDTGDRSKNFFYSWMELSYSPADWFRAGLVAQRSKAYHTDLDVQRGLLLGFSHNKVEFTTYMFNAGWTDPTVVLSVAVHF